MGLSQSEWRARIQRNASDQLEVALADDGSLDAASLVLQEIVGDDATDAPHRLSVHAICGADVAMSGKAGKKELAKLKAEVISVFSLRRRPDAAPPADLTLWIDATLAATDRIVVPMYGEGAGAASWGVEVDGASLHAWLVPRFTLVDLVLDDERHAAEQRALMGGVSALE